MQRVFKNVLTSTFHSTYKIMRLRGIDATEYKHELLHICFLLQSLFTSFPEYSSFTILHLVRCEHFGTKNSFFLLFLVSLLSSCNNFCWKIVCFVSDNNRLRIQRKILILIVSCSFVFVCVFPFHHPNRNIVRWMFHVFILHLWGFPFIFHNYFSFPNWNVEKFQFVSCFVFIFFLLASSCLVVFASLWFSTFSPPLFGYLIWKVFHLRKIHNIHGSLHRVFRNVAIELSNFNVYICEMKLIIWVCATWIVFAVCNQQLAVNVWLNNRFNRSFIFISME